MVYFIIREEVEFKVRLRLRVCRLQCVDVPRQLMDAIGIFPHILTRLRF